MLGVDDVGRQKLTAIIGAAGPPPLTICPKHPGPAQEQDLLRASGETKRALPCTCVVRPPGAGESAPVQLQVVETAYSEDSKPRLDIEIVTTNKDT